MRGSQGENSVSGKIFTCAFTWGVAKGKEFHFLMKTIGLVYI